VLAYKIIGISHKKKETGTAISVGMAKEVQCPGSKVIPI
jgi:hypothetical protein